MQRWLPTVYLIIGALISQVDTARIRRMKRAKKRLPPSKAQLLAAFAWLRAAAKAPLRPGVEDLSPPYCGMHLLYNATQTSSASESPASPLHASESGPPVDRRLEF
jgi:hypothetical protein